MLRGFIYFLDKFSHLYLPWDFTLLLENFYIYIELLLFYWSFGEARRVARQVEEGLKYGRLKTYIT